MISRSDKMRRPIPPHEKLLVNISDISEMTGIGAAKIRAMANDDPTFPAPVSITAGNVGRHKKYFKTSEIIAWFNRL